MGVERKSGSKAPTRSRGELAAFQEKNAREKPQGCRQMADGSRRLTVRYRTDLKVGHYKEKGRFLTSQTPFEMTD